ncbi:MAG: glycoside hydrolase family 172 protein [Kiritimatiellia bacterium]
MGIPIFPARVRTWTRLAHTMFTVFLRSILPCVLFSLAAGCRNRSTEQDSSTWQALVGELTNLERIAYLDVPGASLISSADPTGGNDDYNNFIRKGPKGWWVLADLPGPGWISRFWMTGIRPHQKLRFYFNDERQPRIEKTVEEFFRGGVFACPLAAHEQMCWYSYVPIPYSRRLIVMAEECGFEAGGWPRLFYQISPMPLPQGVPPGDFPCNPSVGDLAFLERISNQWIESTFEISLGRGQVSTNRVMVHPGTEATAMLLEGPAMVRKLEFEVDLSALSSALARGRVLRQVVLRIFWDGGGQPSVEVPIGDFFGSYGHARQFNSMFLGMRHNTFYSRFPMPFRTRCEISLANQSADLTVPVSVRVTTTALPAWRSELGYFHACWRRSGPAPQGRPHYVVSASGKGHYVGCFLHVVSQDPSWWILESDESMRIDSALRPQWRGTGLEDYFNGGWYYYSVTTRPLHGVLLRSPFSTLQYRIHLTDPVRFEKDFEMEFERGPGDTSRGWMESVAYYYLERPGPSRTKLGDPSGRTVPEDPMEPMVIMQRLADEERLGDFAGAQDYTAAFLERYPSHPFAEVLRLRLLSYREWLGKRRGNAAVYAAFAAGTRDTNAAHEARLMGWFHEKAGRALLGAYCGARTRIFLDGRLVGEAADPNRLVVFPIELSPGKHSLALEATRTKEKPWAVICLRTQGGDICSDRSWRCTWTPQGAWQLVEYDDSGWEWSEVADRTPPLDYYPAVVPNAFIGMQSLAKGLVKRDWHEGRTLYLRKVFYVP